MTHLILALWKSFYQECFQETHGKKCKQPDILACCGGVTLSKIIVKDFYFKKQNLTHQTKSDFLSN